jgi:hypothetical protein
MTQRQLIASYIDEHVTADNMQISKGLNMQLNSVTGRLDEMVYLHQTHRICGVNDNNRNIYVKRHNTDPLNTRPKTKAEITQDKLTAVMEGIGLTESDVNAYYRNWIERQIKLSVNKTSRKHFKSK